MWVLHVTLDKTKPLQKCEGFFMPGKMLSLITVRLLFGTGITCAEQNQPVPWSSLPLTTL